MKLHRPERISQLIRDQLSGLILRELEFPGALVTITDVEVTSDLERAKIKMSILPGEKSERVMMILGKAQPRLQFELLRKINIKPMPTIRFELDHGLEKAAAIEKDLLEVEKEEKNR